MEEISSFKGVQKQDLLAGEGKYGPSSHLLALFLADTSLCHLLPFCALPPPPPLNAHISETTLACKPSPSPPRGTVRRPVSALSLSCEVL